MPDSHITLTTDIAIVGAGGCGLIAALVAAEHGAHVIIVEKEKQAGGNTAMSAGLAIAAGSRLQRAAGETGTPEELAADIWNTNGATSDRTVTLALCRASGPTMDWMLDHGVLLELMADYRYPGHSRHWLHATRERHGGPIVGALLAAVARQPRIQLLLSTPATEIVVDDVGAVIGITAQTESGERLSIHTRRMILAADGFGANRQMVARFIPSFTQAMYYGAPGCTGDAINWGMQLGAATAFMDSFQPHSSIAYPERIFVTTYIVNNGGIQVNRSGKRFSDETRGYGEHALAVQQQPDRVVYEIFDGRIRQAAEAGYARFYECADAGVIRSANSLAELATKLDIHVAPLEETVAQYNASIEKGGDEFGRTSFGKPLAPPYFAIPVTSALFHTQGGLVIDARARVLRADGSVIPNLYAGGGTAAGFAGNGCGGYLGGIGLLSAFALGKISGDQAAQGI